MDMTRTIRRTMAAMLAFLMAVCCCVPCVTVFAKSTGHGRTADLSDIFEDKYNNMAHEYFGEMACTHLDKPTTDVSKFNDPEAYMAVMKDVDAWLEDAPKNGSDYDKEKFVYDKIATTCTYKMNGYGCDGTVGAVQAILYNHGGICDTFAKGFKYFCNMLDLKCWYVDGKWDGGNHAFNIIELDGKRYVVNMTGAVSVNDKPATAVDYSHMNMSKKQAERMGLTLSDWSKKYATDWSDCKYDDQDYFKKNNLYFTSYEAMKVALPAIIAKANNEGKPIVSVEFPQNDIGDAMAKEADNKLFAGGEMNDVIKKANLLTPYPVQANVSYGANKNFFGFMISSSHVPKA